MEQTTKRSADGEGERAEAKRQKTKKQWRVPHKNDEATTTIQPGDSGIWATCTRGKEGKCVGELMDLLAEYAEMQYGDAAGAVEPASQGIEQDIQSELAELRQPSSRRLFVPVRINVQCVIFIRTSAPVDPVMLVKQICEDALREPARKRTRFVKRLSPMTLMGRASTEGLEKVGTQVLAPYFRTQPSQTRKFAIRPTLRNHNTLTRDGVIKQVASLVGPGHEVDLKHYDLLVIVEIYQNICGMAVVDASFERLKRYNLAEIYEPTSTPQTE